MVDLHDDSINLRALRKIDDNIREILYSAGQVAIYYFNLDEGHGQWKRKEIEGALFFVKRAVQPEYAFVVINKLNTINLVQKITKDFETSVQQPYLMYKNTENEIYCVWFYDRENCSHLNDKIVAIIDKIKKNQLFPHPNNQFNGLSLGSTNSTQVNSDLLKMMLSVENNNANNNVEAAKVSQPTIPINELVKPIAQRRSVNLKDLFDSHLNISNSNANEVVTPLKGDSNVAPVKPEPVTPYQFSKDENVKNNLPPPLIAPNSSNSNATDPPKDSILKTFDALLQPQKIVPNPTLFEQKTTRKQTDTEAPMYLTMEQLKKSLIYLLQNDADFLHSIHTTYVSAIKK